eukprot:jgi/Pico_ML_1/55520/g1194.t1
MALDVQALKQHQKKIEKLQDKNKKHLEILKLKEEEIERLQNKVDAIQKPGVESGAESVQAQR